METKLRVLNGRTRDNLKGNVINVDYHRWSTNDLAFVLEKSFMQHQMTQHLSVEDSNIFSDHKLILLCLNAKPGYMSNISDNYADQNILLFEKPEAFL